jgi:N-acetylglutamate synthase-like GNAT family acetyltransferase
MKITYREELPQAAAYSALFETTGWNEYYHASSDELYKALKRSWYMVSAYDTKRLAGCGRVVSDGILYAMIYDLIVMPSHRAQGIGTEILSRLVKKCRTAGIRDVQLFSAPGKSTFYAKRGFKTRPSDAPGMRLQR